MQCQNCQTFVRPKLRFTDILVLKKDDTTLCPSCFESFERIDLEHCPNCYKPQEREQCLDCIAWDKKGHHVRHQSLYAYNQAMKDYFSRFKFQGDYLLGQQFKKDLKEALRNYKEYTIVPIPISDARKELRRFNQVEALLDAAQVPYQSLLEKDDTVAQSSKSKKDRLQTKQAFRLKKDVSLPQKILIVDDIYTTGQTLYLATLLFQQHGVRDVKSFSLAR